MRLFLARHGETEWNVEHRMQGWKESELSNEGIEQARLLSERLKDIAFDAIYSSSLRRAIHTAEILRRERALAIVPLDELREIALGPWEGMTFDDVKAKFPKEYETFYSKPQDFRLSGCETFHEVRSRVANALDRIFNEQNSSKNVLVIAHSVAVKMAMAVIERRGVETTWTAPYIPHTGLCIVEIAKDGKENRVLLHGDTSHLNRNNNRPFQHLDDNGTF